MVHMPLSPSYVYMHMHYIGICIYTYMVGAYAYMHHICIYMVYIGAYAYMHHICIYAYAPYICLYDFAIIIICTEVSILRARVSRARVARYDSVLV